MHIKYYRLLLLIFLCCVSVLFVGPVTHTAFAGEVQEDLPRVGEPQGIIYNTNEMHRLGSTINLVGAVTTGDIAACNVGAPLSTSCPVAYFSPSPIDVTFNCAGYSAGLPNGGWALDAAATTGDQCWSALHVCFYTGTINETCVNVGAQTINDANNQQVVHNPNCTPGPPVGTEKDYCAVNYDLVTHAISENSDENITGDTGDDMFKIPPLSHGFFVYNRPGDPDYELRYIERTPVSGSPNNSKDMMLPSGPFTTGTPFSDFKTFMDTPPSFIQTEKACYGVNVRLCEGVVPSPPAVHGICGDATYATTFYTSAPPTTASPTELCFRGVPTAVAGSGPWSWTCNGLNGGLSSNCSANQVVVASCGPADGQNYPIPPTSGLCSTGLPGGMTASGLTWNWSCTGSPSSNPANNTTCSANRIENGVCGMAAGNDYLNASSVNTAGLCAVGAASPASVSGAGPWNWSCLGSNSGTNAACSAGVIPACPAPPTGPDINGTCGNAHGGVYASAAAVPAGQRCLTGAPTSVVDAGATLTWNCNGVGSGVAQSCSANKPAPAPTCATSGTLQTVGNGCINAGYTTEDIDSPHWEELTGPHWPSSGFGPPVNGACLQVGPPVNPNPGQFNLYRLYYIPGCEPAAPVPIAGACGSANGVSTSTQPTSNLCNATGVAATAVDNGTSWDWTCTGQNGGGNAPCSAPKPDLRCCNERGGSPYSNRFLCTNSNRICDGSSMILEPNNCFTGFPSDCIRDTGTCGSADGGSYASMDAFTPGLCATGYLATAPTESAGTFTWFCQDDYNGSPPGGSVLGVGSAFSVPMTGEACSATKSGGPTSCTIPTTGSDTYGGQSAATILANCANGYSGSDWSFNGMGGADTRYIVRSGMAPFTTTNVCHDNVNIPTLACGGGGSLMHAGSNPAQCAGGPVCQKDGTWQQVGPQICAFQVPAEENPRHCESRGRFTSYPPFSPGGPCDIAANAVDGSCNYGEWAQYNGWAPFGSCGGSQVFQRTYECKP